MFGVRVHLSGVNPHDVLPRTDEVLALAARTEEWVQSRVSLARLPREVDVFLVGSSQRGDLVPASLARQLNGFWGPGWFDPDGPHIVVTCRTPASAERVLVHLVASLCLNNGTDAGRLPTAVAEGLAVLSEDALLGPQSGATALVWSRAYIHARRACLNPGVRGLLAESYLSAGSAHRYGPLGNAEFNALSVALVEWLAEMDCDRGGSVVGELWRNRVGSSPDAAAKLARILSMTPIELEQDFRAFALRREPGA